MSKKQETGAITVMEFLQTMAALLDDGDIDYETPLVFSSDSEWNTYHFVHYLPNPWHYDKEERMLYDESQKWKKTINALCIN